MLQGLQQHVLSWRINKKVFSSSRISFPSCSCCVRVAHRWMYCIVYSVLQRSQKSCEPSSLVSLSRIFLTLREKAWFVRWSECGVQLNAYVAETEVIKCYGFFFFFTTKWRIQNPCSHSVPAVSLVCVCACEQVCNCPGSRGPIWTFQRAKEAPAAPVWRGPS